MDLLPCTGKVGDQKAAPEPCAKLRPQRRHRHRGAAQLNAIHDRRECPDPGHDPPAQRHPIDQHPDRMLPVAQQIPVDQHAKAVVAVPAHARRVRPLRPIRRGHLHDGPVLLLDLNRDAFGLAHPARNEPQSTLKRAGSRVLQIADHQAGAQRVGALRPSFAGDGDDHVAGLDRRSEPEVGSRSAARGCPQLFPSLPDSPPGIGASIGLNDQHAGLGQTEPKVVHVAPGVDTPGDRARPWGGGPEGDARGLGRAVAVIVAGATAASAPATCRRWRVLADLEVGELRHCGAHRQIVSDDAPPCGQTLPAPGLGRVRRRLVAVQIERGRQARRPGQTHLYGGAQTACHGVIATIEGCQGIDLPGLGKGGAGRWPHAEGGGIIGGRGPLDADTRHFGGQGGLVNDAVPQHGEGRGIGIPPGGQGTRQRAGQVGEAEVKTSQVREGVRGVTPS